jgi:glycosyltransferase involved in cell wall biosynthesis
MKKVAFVYKFLPQYRKDFFYRLKEILLEYNVELFLFYGKSKNKDALKNDEIDIEWGKFIPNKSFKIGKYELVWQPCLKELKNMDLVIVQPENKLILNYYLMFARNFSKYKLGFWGHGRNMQAPIGSLKNRFKSLYLKKCNWWFAYTKGVKEVVANLHFQENKITIVQNAIDTLNLKKSYCEISDNDIRCLKDSLGIRGDNVGIFCGGMYPEKRIDFIINTCLSIKKQVPDFHMIFIGGGIDSNKVIKASNDTDWIHYAGPKFGEDRVKYFRISSIQLMPGLVGLGILDSFALETPIVTTTYPFHSPEIDYLEDGINGVITDDNQNIYTRAVIDLLKTRKYEDLIKGCRTSAEKYTVEAMVTNFKNGILSCLGIKEIPLSNTSKLE